MKTIIAIALCLIASTAISGDYMLYISDVYDCPCTERPRKVHEWCEQQKLEGKKCDSDISWPIKTSSEVAESLRDYFNGRTPEISILISAFANGHYHFCGKAEVETVYRTLVDLRNNGVIQHKPHLNDFLSKVENLMWVHITSACKRTRKEAACR